MKKRYQIRILTVVVKKGSGFHDWARQYLQLEKEKMALNKKIFAQERLENAENA